MPPRRSGVTSRLSEDTAPPNQPPAPVLTEEQEVDARRRTEVLERGENPKEPADPSSQGEPQARSELGDMPGVSSSNVCMYVRTYIHTYECARGIIKCRSFRYICTPFTWEFRHLRRSR